MASLNLHVYSNRECSAQPAPPVLQSLRLPEPEPQCPSFSQTLFPVCQQMLTTLVKATVISCLINCPPLLPNLSPCATFALLPIPGREQIKEPAKIHNRPRRSHAQNPVIAFPLTHSKIQTLYNSTRCLLPAPVTLLTRALLSPTRPPRTGHPAAPQTRQTHSHLCAPCDTHSSPRYLHDPLPFLH